jgi:hypothetical protein
LIFAVGVPRGTVLALEITEVAVDDTGVILSAFPFVLIVIIHFVVHARFDGLIPEFAFAHATPRIFAPFA